MLPLTYRVKAQEIRQLDVWLIGPLMMWGGLVLSGRSGKESPLAGDLLFLTGIATILYNHHNYKRVEVTGER